MLSHECLNFGETVSLQLPLEQFPTSFSELSHGGQESLDALLLIQQCRRIVAGIGQRQLIDRFLMILAPAQGFAMSVQHFKAEYLKGQGDQLSQFGDAQILFLQHNQDFLREVLGEIPRYT